MTKEKKESIPEQNKPYKKPSMTLYGKVSELTSGGSVHGSEGSASHTKMGAN